MAQDNLVIVESPAKAKTIEKYLGPDYKVLASFGHIRDLLPKDGAVRPDEDFAMDWVLGDRAHKNVKEIERAVKTSKTLYLATDPDREGEAISWHVKEYLDEKNLLKGRTIHRVTFNEITKSAIQTAFKQPREINAELVEAYLARRALDFLVGFNLSPILWRKLPGARSAGRVQSVALRLICEREFEIEQFKPQEYWSVEALFQTNSGATFTARLTHFDGQKLDKFAINNETRAQEILAALQKQNFTVSDVTKKEVKRHPAAPFITSSLQMEASRKLGFGASQTMRTAQKLYEGVTLGGETVGLITYMRTDGVQLSQDAIYSCRTTIDKLYGQDYLPEQPRIYSSKAKNAQEAHEAIRPTDLARTPDYVAKYVDHDQARLYELIWKRTLAAQMASAVLDQATVDITGTNKAAFRATGSVVKFDGFFKLYFEDTDDMPSDSEDNRRLPPLTVKDALQTNSIKPEQHFTQPPPRFSEASLVKALEELGIGRPSTYASIIQVLQDRNYVRLDKKRFVPEDRGRIVTTFLTNFFRRYVEYDFTAALEGQLDEISAGALDWKDMLRKFWVEFIGAVDETKPLTITQVIDVLDAELDKFLFPPRADGSDPRKCPRDSGRLGLKLGKFGAFVGCSNYPECKETRPLGLAESAAAANGGGVFEPREIGIDPDSGEVITIKLGPYGPYLERPNGDNKPKRASLTPGTNLDAITLEDAVKLLLLPREVGIFPETGDPIYANVGRFGPYIQTGKLLASLPKGETAQDIGPNRAVDILMEKIARSLPVKELDNHPDDDAPIGIYRSRFGFVIRHNDIEARLAKGTDPQDIDSATAILLLKQMGKPAFKFGKKKGKGKTTAPKKTAVKKTAVKKTAAKKTAAKKSAVKKTAAKQVTAK